MVIARRHPHQVTIFEHLERIAPVDPWAHIYCAPEERWGPEPPPRTIGPKEAAFMAAWRAEHPKPERKARGVGESPQVRSLGRPR